MSESEPSYRQLDEHGDYRLSWGVFGAEDEIGTVNRLGPAQVLAGVSEVVAGRAFSLSLPMNLPDPGLLGRGPYRHQIIRRSKASQDEVIDNLYTQASSQWDGLRHHGLDDIGYYNGASASEVGSAGSKLGVDKWNEHTIVGRGVLADVRGHCAAAGVNLHARERFEIDVHLLETVLATEKVDLRKGDVLMVRTGYAEDYLVAPTRQRRHWFGQVAGPGLSPTTEMAEFLWDNGLSAVVADNIAVEVLPVELERGFLHKRLIAGLGFALGELFFFGELARYCAAQERYSCLFSGTPLNIPGGVGSPANAIAIM